MWLEISVGSAICVKAVPCTPANRLQIIISMLAVIKFFLRLIFKSVVSLLIFLKRNVVFSLSI